MRSHHIIRVGALGGVESVGAAGLIRYPRGADVIVRTLRGLEVAQVLAPPDGLPAAGAAFGEIVRAMTDKDRLLQARLEVRRHAAYRACADRLAELDAAAVLVDVEHLFDGQNLVFYFLGDVSPEVEQFTQQLAEAYEVHAQFRRFTETLAAGCGPLCGTDEATGCGSCGDGCALAGHCGVRG